jgi:L-asparaginase
MSYSASALSFLCEIKTSCVYGSQLPIGDLRTDAKNLITAIQIASCEMVRQFVSEVCLYFEYKLYRGNRTTKINAEHFKGIHFPNYPELVESGVNLIRRELLLPIQQAQDWWCMKRIGNVSSRFKCQF